TPHEKRVIADADQAELDLKPLREAGAAGGEVDGETRTRIAILESAITAGRQARIDLGKRKKKRRDHAVASENAGKIRAMVEMALPHMRRPASAFNADPLAFATRSHTLRFVKVSDPDTDGASDVWQVETRKGHRRGDLMTSCLQTAYDAAATAPKW